MQGYVLSDGVNLTARLENLTKLYGTRVIISGETIQNLANPKKYSLRFLDMVIVKGRTAPVAIFELLEALLPQKMALRLQTQASYEQGVAYYRKQQFSQAQACFETMQAIDPNDLLAQIYLQRVTQAIEHGLPTEWDSVITLIDK
jgi:adenylate cyclase